MWLALVVGGALAASLGVAVIVVLAVVLWPRGAAAPTAVPVVVGPGAPAPLSKPPADAPPEGNTAPRKPALPKDGDKPTPPDLKPTPPDLKPTPPDLKPAAPPEDKPAPPDVKPDGPIARAVDRGVAYLKALIDDDFAGDNFGGGYHTGVAALAGLALLESGVPADDPAVKKAAAAVRENAASNNNTYEMSLCVWFLDRLGDAKDEALIRSLAKRLVAGQGSSGMWDYDCQPGANGNDLSLTQFAVLGLWVARKHKAPVDAALRRIEGRCRASQTADGGWDYEMLRDGQSTQSMTCAGLMVLAVGRGAGKDQAGKDDAKDPAVEKALRHIGEMFNGWVPPPPPLSIPDDQMAAVQATGEALQPFRDVLLKRTSGEFWSIPPKHLRAGRAEVEKALALDLPDEVKDRLRKALDTLKTYNGASIATARDLLDTLGGPLVPVVPQTSDPGQTDLYTLWSMERMAVVYNFKTITGRDWYLWGSQHLVASQKENGEWAESYGGAVDTSFALLFLKRSNVAQDLTDRMQQLGPIKDVILDKVSAPSPGETPSRGPGPAPSDKPAPRDEPPAKPRPGAP